MIVIVCTDDRILAQIAEAHAKDDPDIYGRCYQVFDAAMPRLGDAENLFVTAHGARKGDDGNPVIGSAKNALYLNAVQLFANLKPLFTPAYAGRVYISACESADGTPGSLSFAEAFRNVLVAETRAIGVWGQKGGVGLNIPSPDSRGWIGVGR